VQDSEGNSDSSESLELCRASEFGVETADLSAIRSSSWARNCSLRAHGRHISGNTSSNSWTGKLENRAKHPQNAIFIGLVGDLTGLSRYGCEIRRAIHPSLNADPFLFLVWPKTHWRDQGLIVTCLVPRYALQKYHRDGPLCSVYGAAGGGGAQTYWRGGKGCTCWGAKILLAVTYIY
jgi:hypothetical protein